MNSRGTLVRLAVGLKSEDPAAITALSTLRELMPDHCPIELHRYNLWELSVLSSRPADVVEDLVGHYTDIVNPNKQHHFYPGPEGRLPGENPELLWIGAIVRDNHDSLSENWTSILGRSSFPVAAVRVAVSWRLGYSSDADPSSCLESAHLVAVTTDRRTGLLANPISQTVEIQAEA